MAKHLAEWVVIITANENDGHKAGKTWTVDEGWYAPYGKGDTWSEKMEAPVREIPKNATRGFCDTMRPRTLTAVVRKLSSIMGEYVIEDPSRFSIRNVRTGETIPWIGLCP